ncbi:hypothetical protein [Reyranella sp.]|uniref:hypothetical protein n=1 Tax=Reyranella sp. TaxID=1929291 RepID=UPI003BA90ED5
MATEIRGLLVGLLMMLGAVVATYVVALAFETVAVRPVDNSYSPLAEATVDRRGLPLRKRQLSDSAPIGDY